VYGCFVILHAVAEQREKLQQTRSSDDGGSVTGFLRIIAYNSAMIRFDKR